MCGAAKVEALLSMTAAEPHRIGPSRDRHRLQCLIGPEDTRLTRQHRRDVIVEGHRHNLVFRHLYSDVLRAHRRAQTQHQPGLSHLNRSARIRPAIGAASIAPDRPCAVTTTATSGDRLGANPANQTMCVPFRSTTVPVFPATFTPGTAASCDVPYSTDPSSPSSTSPPARVASAAYAASKPAGVTNTSASPIA